MTSRLANGLGLTLAVSFAVALSGCGKPVGNNESTTPMEASSEAKGANCHEERPLGSNIARTVCRSDDQAKRERENTRSFINRPRASPTATAPD